MPDSAHVCIAHSVATNEASQAHLSSLRVRLATSTSWMVIAATVPHCTEPAVLTGSKLDSEPSQGAVTRVMDILREAGYEFELIEGTLQH